jgi:hypothetical protein
LLHQKTETAKMTELDFLRKYKHILSITAIEDYKKISKASLFKAIQGSGKLFKPTEKKVKELLQEIKEDLNKLTLIK